MNTTHYQDGKIGTKKGSSMKISAEQITGKYIAPRIIEYLESHDKSADAQVLQETVNRMRQVLVRDLMQPRDTRAGRESNTLYSGPCARKARLTFDGADREPLRARTVLKFLLGDMVELSVLAMARLAGCHIEDNNIDLTVTGEDGKAIAVHPDGRYIAPDGQQFNIEIKSCDSKTFDRWIETGGPDDTWGYLSQASMEVEAWRSYGYNIDGTLFLAVSTGSRQGSIDEFYRPHDPELVAAWHKRRNLARLNGVPAIPFQAAPEIVFKRGKTLRAEDTIHGDPSPRTNESGAIYGWDVPTGRQVVPLVCSYCDFREKQCWPDAVMELDGGKPVWVVSAPGASPSPGPEAATVDGPILDGQPSAAPSADLTDLVIAIREADEQGLNVLLKDFVKSGPSKVDLQTINGEIERRRKALRGK